jgi:hypothetical protein
MYKPGTFWFFLLLPDQSHAGQTAFCHSFELMTVALRKSTMRPYFWLLIPSFTSF